MMKTSMYPDFVDTLRNQISIKLSFQFK